MQQDGGGAEAEQLAGALLTIDLDALAANWRALAARAAEAECAAVVKADAYGIGIEPAVAALARAGCQTFFVAHPGEGVRARAVAPGATVYVLNGLPPGAAGAFVSAGLRPVLGAPAEVDEWCEFAATRGGPLPAAVHIDTGMNRLGLTLAEARVLAARRTEGPFFQIALVMSHLVAAEEADRPINRLQIERFAAVRALFPRVPASLCNSSGLFLPQSPCLDLVRPGYALYGGNPTPGQPNPMRPVIGLAARVIQVREAAAGDTVGYNGRWAARAGCRIATISCGYADGIPRAASGTDGRPAGLGGVALVNGQPCPFAGVISMDLITVDVTDTPPGAVKVGDRVTLIGGPLDLETVAARAGTIGYEILTSLGRRYARRYLGGA
ncbi:alanine racemase [Chelatococcus reniformis]|nr:alanine racemase [Chelatococcus reniformis]